jgi:hypothetical protein
MRLFSAARLPLVNENFSKPTVRHSSTIFFRCTENLIQKISAIAYSEREAGCMSSGEDVTATGMMQTGRLRQRRHQTFVEENGRRE